MEIDLGTNIDATWTGVIVTRRGTGDCWTGINARNLSVKPRSVQPVVSSAIQPLRNGFWVIDLFDNSGETIMTIDLEKVTNQAGWTHDQAGLIQAAADLIQWISLSDGGTVIISTDKNWGVVGANTLRTAAEIGNATGAADFNTGVLGAQTLRVTNATNDPLLTDIRTNTSDTASEINTANTTLSTIASAVRAEDTASADGDKGIGALVIQKATPADTAGTDGDYSFLQMSGGLLWTKARTDLTTPGTTNLVATISGQNGVMGNTGVVTANTQRVTLATDIALPAGENHLGEIGGNMILVQTNFTRPADTTAYAAKDTVSNSTSSPSVITFSNIARIANGTGYITKARLMLDDSLCTARFRLHLYNTSPTAINDNSPFTLLYANFGSRIGHIDFPACNTEGTGSNASNSWNYDIRLGFTCTGGAKTIYGILEILDAYTPISGGKYSFELGADNN